MKPLFDFEFLKNLSKNSFENNNNLRPLHGVLHCVLIIRGESCGWNMDKNETLHNGWNVGIK